jgi:hypothetical protein
MGPAYQPDNFEWSPNAIRSSISTSFELHSKSLLRSEKNGPAASSVCLRDAKRQASRLVLWVRLIRAGNRLVPSKRGGGVAQGEAVIYGVIPSTGHCLSRYSTKASIPCMTPSETRHFRLPRHHQAEGKTSLGGSSSITAFALAVQGKIHLQSRRSAAGFGWIVSSQSLPGK